MILGCMMLGTMLSVLRGDPATSAPSARIYISNEQSGDISVIDPQTRKVVATIPVGKRPRGIQLSPDFRTAYVALSGTPITPPGTERGPAPSSDKDADGIGVIDLDAHKLVRKLPAGSDPEQFAVARDGSRIYISNEDANALSVLDIARGDVISTVSVGTEPEGVAISPDGTRVYVTSETTNQVHVIGAKENTVIGSFKIAQRPRSIAFLPDGSKAYVTCETASVVCVVDVASSKVIKQLTRAGEMVRPMGIVISPDGKFAYVTTGRGGSVLEIDTARDPGASASLPMGARSTPPTVHPTPSRSSTSTNSK